MLGALPGTASSRQHCSKPMRQRRPVHAGNAQTTDISVRPGSLRIAPAWPWCHPINQTGHDPASHRYASRSYASAAKEGRAHVTIMMSDVTLLHRVLQAIGAAGRACHAGLRRRRPSPPGRQRELHQPLWVMLALFGEVHNFHGDAIALSRTDAQAKLWHVIYLRNQPVPGASWRFAIDGLCEIVLQAFRLSQSRTSESFCHS
jgi:hypothetical protein